jgi:ELWxxDGT repeat protein
MKDAAARQAGKSGRNKKHRLHPGLLFILLFIFLLTAPGISQAVSPPYQVRDINQTQNSSNPNIIADAGSGIFYFGASDGPHGYELWRGDSVGGGAYMVKDINVQDNGAGGTMDSNPSKLTVMDGVVYFFADDGVHGTELWRSDGTEEGTVMVKDINPGADSCEGDGLINVGGTLYFTAYDPDNGDELWRSDGTEEGTVMVKDIAPGGDSSWPYCLTNAAGTLYFCAWEPDHGGELWKSDGTEEGTVLVKDINPGGDNAGPYNLAAVGGTLYFNAMEWTHGEELWRSDGTEAGTYMVKDIAPGTDSSPQWLTDVDGTLFFSAWEPDHGWELWRSDGTEESTYMVRDINPDGGSGPYGLRSAGSKLYFSAWEPDHGYELWKSDGTEEGTVMVKDINGQDNGSGGTQDSWPDNLTNVDGTLYFTANDGVHGNELWTSDGDPDNPDGTHLVVSSNTDGQDIWPGSGDSNPSSLTAVGSVLFFNASNPWDGYELWRSDGTTDGTSEFADINTMDPDSNPQYLTAVGGMLYFRANDGVNGNQLWRSDGTWNGTRMVKDIRPGGDPDVQNLKNAGGALFFVANDGTRGYELWKSDGTEEGTAMVKDINPSGDSWPFNMTDVDGTLYFAADDGVHGWELWRSDGTEAGTVMVKDINPAGDSWPDSLADFGGTLYFVANSGPGGRIVWKSDGTAEGTVELTGTYADAGSLKAVDGKLYFRATDGTHGWELWKYDGTGADAVMVKDINAQDNGSGGTWYSWPDNLTEFGGVLYFTADDGVNGRLVWKSDGTEAGTAAVGQGMYYYSDNLAVVDGTLYFSAYEPVHGWELWRSDGTDGGTAMVKDINTRDNGSGWTEDSSPENLRDVDGTLYFTAYEDTHGIELWRSDGTEEGTVMVSDIKTGTAGSNIENLKVVGGALFFAANDGSNGEELWNMYFGNQPPVFTGTPYITGAAMVGGTLGVAGTGTFDGDGNPVTLSYQWRADGADIDGATSASFVVTQSQPRGTIITCVVTADDGQGGTATATTSGVTVGNAPPVFSGIPAITGTPRVDNILGLSGANVTDPDGDTVTVGYQWRSNGSDISGATQATFTLTSAQAHTNITCVVSADDGHGGTLGPVTTASVFVGNVAPAFTGTPAISGTPYTYATLGLADTGVTDVDGDYVSIYYQWYADGTAIGGATSSTLKLAGAQAHKNVTCRITASDGQGGSTPVTTAAVGVANTAPAFTTPPTLSLSWGSTGSGNGQFNIPSGMAVDSSGNVYVSDRNNHRIQKFTSSGTFITKWGSNGSGDGQFAYPYGVAVDGSNYVYVADSSNNRVQKFDSDGNFITKWGSYGTGDGQFSTPYGIAADGSGNVYVADYGNNRVQKFDWGGNFISRWSVIPSPEGVAVDGAGSVYVVANINYLVQKFTPAGSLLASFGSYGTGNGQFRSPIYVAVDGAGNVYVTDSYTTSSAVQKFGSNGNYIARCGASQFTGVAVDSSGNVYAADVVNNRIQKFVGGTPSITGTALVGNALGISNAGTTDADGDTVTPGYQWKADANDISGATGATLTLTSAQAHKVITCQLTAGDAYGGTAGPATTTGVTVANTAPAFTSGPAITGTALVGSVLAIASGLSDLDGDTLTPSYQWKAGGTNITGATGATFTPTSAQAHQVITCTVTAIDGYGGTAGPVTTTGVTVGNTAPAFTGTPTITGTAVMGNTLGLAGTGTADIDGDTVTIGYQWTADGTNIDGATSSTLLLTSAQVQKSITCSITASDTYGGTTPATTAGVTVDRTATTTSVSSSSISATINQPVTFTATVAPSAATGTATFKDGAATIGTGTLTGGAATFTTSSLASGTHSITAVYGGDALYQPSTSSAITQTVVPLPVSSITAPANGAVIGGAIYTVTGTGTATGLKKVEVGITPDGGTTTWRIATGTASWSYNWTLPDDGGYTIQSRATNDNDVVEAPGQGVTVTVSSGVMVKAVSAWGGNAKGQLGDGTTTERHTPVSVSSLTNVIAIAAGYYHTGAVKTGNVWTWGANTYGQLGDGTTTERHAPVSVSGLSGVVAIASGYYDTLALKSDGTVWAWGANYASQLGDGTTTDRHAPVAVTGLSGVVAIASGCYYHTIALKSDGTVWTWGGNYSGELGDGTTTNRSTPVQVKLQGGSPLGGIVAIAGGSDHTLALKSDGTVWAWGLNLYGQLGDGTTTERHNPVAVSGLSGIIAIASGENHSLAIKSDGTVWAWGYNAYGGLGDGTTTNRSAPVQVKLQDGSTPLGGVASVSGGPECSVACKTDGTVWAWGANYYGQLGDGTTTERHYPVAVSGLSSAVAIAGGGTHAAALRYIMDTTPPSSVITAPSNGALPPGVICTVAGTATGAAGGSSVRKVEVGITPSGGSTTWYTASGTVSWSYDWVLPISGSINIKSRATSVAGIIEEPLAGVNVTVTAYGNPELQHANWDTSFTNGNCNLWNVTAGAFLAPASGSLAYNLNPSLCRSCHNAAGVAHDRRHNGNDHYMTPPVSIPDYLVCTSCHDPLSKSEDYGRTWEYTTTTDRITYTLQRGGWTVYGRQTPVVYRSASLWSGPTYSKDKKKYRVDPSEYAYDETAGTITFKTQQALTDYIYVTLDYPYLKASSKDNRLCLQCHTTQITHKGNNCLACHAPHDTDNALDIRQSVRTPNRSTITVRFQRYTGLNSFADGDSTRDGICEVCHTTTKYYRKDGSGFANHSGGTNHDGKDCTSCHSHSTGFSR